MNLGTIPTFGTGDYWTAWAAGVDSGDPELAKLWTEHAEANLRRSRGGQFEMPLGEADPLARRVVRALREVDARVASLGATDVTRALLRKDAILAASRLEELPFAMISTKDMPIALRIIRERAERKLFTMELFMLCVCSLAPNQSIITKGYRQLAEELGAPPTKTSSAMNDLVALGLLSKKRNKLRFTYCVRPAHAWVGQIEGPKGWRAARKAEKQPSLPLTAN
jgi:hypothetical protein